MLSVFTNKKFVVVKHRHLPASWIPKLFSNLGQHSTSQWSAKTFVEQLSGESYLMDTG
jgi:hypothetical protein